MVHDTLALRTEIDKWLPIFRASLGLSQNDFARGAGIDPSIFSRWKRGVITSEPSERKASRYLARLKRRVVARERAS